MKLRFVLGIFPAFVFLHSTLPDRVVGSARLFMVFIQHGYEGDKSVLEHELKHVEQFYVCTLVGALAYMVLLLALEQMVMPWPLIAVLAVFIHPLAYRFCAEYRAEAEGAAFSEQARHPNKDGVQITREQAAGYLAGPRYKLNMTPEQAMAYIDKESTP